MHFRVFFLLLRPFQRSPLHVSDHLQRGLPKKKTKKTSLLGIADSDSAVTQEASRGGAETNPKRKEIRPHPVRRRRKVSLAFARPLANPSPEEAGEEEVSAQPSLCWISEASFPSKREEEEEEEEGGAKQNPLFPKSRASSFPSSSERRKKISFDRSSVPCECLSARVYMCVREERRALEPTFGGGGLIGFGRLLLWK